MIHTTLQNGIKVIVADETHPWPKELKKRIDAVISPDWSKGYLAYGDEIYCCQAPEDHIIVHELVHIQQQKEIGLEEWWDRWLLDTAFRLSQEIPAYHEQYSFLRSQGMDRNTLHRILYQMASFISGKEYGYLIPHGEAMERIKNNLV